jgi:hypothetical protein
MYGTTDGGRTWKPVEIPGRTVNRFEKINGHTMFTASTRGILRYDLPAGSTPASAAAATTPPQNCSAISGTAKITELGAFSNIRSTAEHAYGDTVMLWKTGSCVFGLLVHTDGLQADMPIGEITDIKYDEKNGALSFVARLTTGVITIPGTNRPEPARSLFMFDGRLERSQLTGVMSRDLEGTSAGNIKSKAEPISLKSSARETASMRGSATYAEWQAKWQPILAARRPK